MTVPEQQYHQDAAKGLYLTSSMLKEFRRSRSRYRDIVAGKARPVEKNAFRFGRAVHALLLEGEAAYRSRFHIGGPLNERTGKGFGSTSRAFRRWLDENGLDSARVLTRQEDQLAHRLRDAVVRHPEAARLLAQGWPEQVVAGEIAGMACRARLDWLHPTTIIVDLKTVQDLARFEADARRFGYLHQFAFYRSLVRAVSGEERDIHAIVVEKNPPHRVGVWIFCQNILSSYEKQVAVNINDLRKCIESNFWPTGYEKARYFPPVGIHPFMLN